MQPTPGVHGHGAVLVVDSRTAAPGWLSLGMRSFRTFGAATTSWRTRSQRTGGWLQRSTSSPWPSHLGVGSCFNMPRVAGTQQRRGALRPARSDLNRAVINARNEHGVASRARLRNRLVGVGGHGWAGNQETSKVRAPRPAVCPCRRRQPWPIGCLAQGPCQHERLARRHQLPNLAAAVVELVAVLVADVECGSHDGQQLGKPSHRLTGQPYVHLDLLRHVSGTLGGMAHWRSAPSVPLHLEAGRRHMAFTIGLYAPFSRRSDWNQPQPRYSSATPSAQMHSPPKPRYPGWQVRRSPARGLRER
jgi:hypothetical protein